jgi:hypothetical protein
MSTENFSNRALELALLALGILFLGYAHFFALREAPGLHFDEAWAMNFAHRIATEPGFWPLTAQSPYTSPWAHYWAALWMRIFGSELLVFRASQVFFSFGGLLFLGLSLRDQGLRRAALWLPLSAALLPGLVLNHRFAIELNGLHAFCFGLAIWGLRRAPWLSALAWIVGSTAHILFFALGLALLGALIWEKRELRRADRVLGFVSASILAGFFYRVYLLIPEKGKGFALFLVALLAAFAFLLPIQRWVPRQKWLDSAVGIVAAVFLANALFFLEGSWSVAISTGLKPWQGQGSIGLLLFLPLALFLVWRGTRELPRFARRWFLLGVIILGAMMLKAAPRYYETALLALTVFFALGFAALPALQRWMALLLLALHAAWLYPLYFLTTPKEESLYLLAWKDSSRDFLSKQALVTVLGGSGCSLSDIKSVDSRVRESLLALSYGDWQQKAVCPYKELQVQRRAEADPIRGREEVADFVFWSP